MANGVKELTDSNFAEETAKGVALVDFWAPWCGPCKMMIPILEEVAGKIGERAIVAKINIDEYSKMAEKYSVRSIPTLIIFKDGEAVQTFVGVQQGAALVTAIEKLLG
jgi:thioredoxin 1